MATVQDASSDVDYQPCGPATVNKTTYPARDNL